MKSQRVARGYIALMATIITGFILLGISVDESLAGWHARFNVLSSENKEQANALAEGCADQALASLIADPHYTKNITSTNAQGTCTVTIDDSIQGLATIKSQGEVRGSFANLEMTVNLNNVHIGAAPTTPTTGTLVVYLNLINNNNGGSPMASFNVSIPSGTPTTYSGVQSRAITVTGAYTLSITGPTGYATTYSGDCTSSGAGSVGAGEVKSCTATIDDLPTTITLVANVTNNASPPGPKNSSDFQLQIDGVNQVQNVPISVAPGVHTVSGPGADSSYNASLWGYNCAGNGTITLAAGEQRTCVINYDDVTPPGLQCVDTLMMLDRTISMFGQGPQPSQAMLDEEEAGRALIDLFNPLLPHSLLGVGRFGDGGAGDSADIIGTMTPNYGVRGGGGTFTGPFPPTQTAAPNGLWSNASQGESNDALFATNSTSGQQQGYGYFNLAVPPGAAINGIEVYADGKTTGSAPAPTGTLLPNGQGFYNTINAWANGESTLDENSNPPNCGTSGGNPDYIQSNTTNQRESVLLNLASVPNGSTITSVQVLTWDVGSGSSGGSYRTFVRTGGTNTDATTDLTTTSTSGCTARSQSIPMNVVKSVATAFEVGVLKTGANGNTVRVGAIRAVVTYTSIQGDVYVQLWNAQSNSWTNYQTATFGATESLQQVSTSNDLWGKSWVQSNFANGTFVLRVQNNAPAGVTAHLNYTTVKVWYTVPSSGLYAAIDNGFPSGTVTNLAAAFSVGSNELVQHGDATKNNVLILISDGVNINHPCQGNCGNGGGTTQYALDAALTAASNAKGLSGTNALKVFILHFGSDTESGQGVPACVGTCFLSKLVSPSSLPVATIAVNGAVRSGGTATITTTSAHNLAVNQYVSISGVGNAAFNATKVLVKTLLSPTKFTYALSGTNLTSGGGVVTPTNLFEAPNSTDLPAVFQSIGKQACPALLLASTPPPTTGTLTIVTNVVNDSNSGNKTASQFTISIASQTNPGSAAGQSVALNPGGYNVTGSADAGYTTTYSANCSSVGVGPIAAGETRTCTVTYDDVPAPPPPANLNINLGSWQETPQ